MFMGIAVASGVPPALGLITGMVGGLVVGFLAGSPLQVSGPAAGLAVIVWESARWRRLSSKACLAAIVGLITIAVIVACTRFRPTRLAFLPAPLMAVVIGVVAVYVGGFQIKYVDVPSNLLDAIMWPTRDSLAVLGDPAIWGAAAHWR